MTALVSIDNKEITCENEFAHITLMTGEWKPVQSNDILKTLFNQSYGVRKSSKFENECDKVNVVMYKNQKTDVYIVTPPDKTTFEGLMKCYD